MTYTDLPYGLVSIKVWGDFACFTIPEFGVERVSYPTMTPTAAVGILDAIYWHPQFRWRVVAIDTLRPVQYTQVRRNEIKSRQTEAAAKRWMNGDDDGLDAGSDSVRTQRNAVILYDVGYVIHANAMLLPEMQENTAKFRDQTRRRIARGRCYERPYLGTREFSCDFGEPTTDDVPIMWNQDIGPMILSVYAGDPDPSKQGKASPMFFDARVRDGRLLVPSLPEGRR